MRSLLAVVLLCVQQTLGARILAVLPISAPSHHQLLHAVLKTLAARGHEVVSYSHVPLQKPVANYTDVVLDNNVSLEQTLTKEIMESLMTQSPVRPFTLLWNKNFGHFGQDTLKDKKVIKLLESNEKFDIIILETFFCQEVLLSLGHKYKAPVISIQPFGALSLVNRAAGNSLSLAFIPEFSFPCSDHMSFYERALSAYSILSTLFVYYTQYLPEQDNFIRQYFNDPTMPSVVDMITNISLYFNNAHPNVHYAQPYTPNLIPIGGIHLQKEYKPLPPNMLKFLDEAKSGVIYFSLGSIMPDQILAKDFFDSFLRVFRRLPQRILWKTGSQLSGLPDNVMTASWVPQQDVLAHPNVILFITHGGLFSQHEAINAGVPVVCIPLFGDQSMNAKFYKFREIGVELPFNFLSEETIYAAVTTVLNSSKFGDNMKRLSSVYRDQPVSPAKSLVFWVEYVIRHRGASHLRPVSAQISWYQLFLVDVLAVLLGVAALVVAAIWFSVYVGLKWLKKWTGTATYGKKKKTH